MFLPVFVSCMFSKGSEIWRSVRTPLARGAHRVYNDEPQQTDDDTVKQMANVFACLAQSADFSLFVCGIRSDVSGEVYII